jgi:hypothetical protein
LNREWSSIVAVINPQSNMAAKGSRGGGANSCGHGGFAHSGARKELAAMCVATAARHPVSRANFAAWTGTRSFAALSGSIHPSPDHC